MPRILPLACLTFLLAACSGPSDTGPAAKGPPPVTVSLTTAASTPVETRVRALAMVEATHAPQVVAEVTGRVTEVLADVGDTVKAGQPLARLDARDVSASRVSADAEVARLTALADQASRDLRRGRELAQQGFISPSAVDDLVAKSHAASELLSAGRAKAGQASNDEDRAIVRAPIAGRVDARLVAVGDWAAAGKGLFVVNGRQGGLRLRVGLAGRDPRSVQPGQIVRLVTDAGDTLEVPVG
ncbi:MAG: efflux RND transporter periplasmic adaptor subunit, partial [Laribacter sp.]|nr:efflux RND transporter periplasmic adaptor subunit [Laribacter sp.]